MTGGGAVVGGAGNVVVVVVAPVDGGVDGDVELRPPLEHAPNPIPASSATPTIAPLLMSPGYSPVHTTTVDPGSAGPTTSTPDPAATCRFTTPWRSVA